MSCPNQLGQALSHPDVCNSATTPALPGAVEGLIMRGLLSGPDTPTFGTAIYYLEDAGAAGLPTISRALSHPGLSPQVWDDLLMRIERLAKAGHSIQAVCPDALTRIITESEKSLTRGRAIALLSSAHPEYALSILRERAQEESSPAVQRVIRLRLALLGDWSANRLLKDLAEAVHSGRPVNREADELLSDLADQAREGGDVSGVRESCLADLLDVPPSPRRRLALEVLCRHPGPQAHRLLRKIAEEVENDYLSSNRAEDALACRADPWMAERLLERSRLDEWQERARAVEKLALYGPNIPPAARDRVGELLHDTKGRVISAAIFAFRSIPAREEDAAAIWDIWKSGGYERYLGEHIVRTLVEIGAPAVPVLARAALDPGDAKGQAHAVVLLGRIGHTDPKNALPALVNAIRGDNEFSKAMMSLRTVISLSEEAERVAAGMLHDRSLRLSKHQRNGLKAALRRTPFPFPFP